MIDPSDFTTRWNARQICWSGSAESHLFCVVPYGRSARIMSTEPSGISFIRSRQSPRRREMEGTDRGVRNLLSPYATQRIWQGFGRTIFCAREIGLGRAEKLVAVEVNHVIRVLRDPDFSVPRDVMDVPSELREIEKRAHVDQVGGATFEHLV